MYIPIYLYYLSIYSLRVELLPEATKSTQVIRSFLECDKASSEGCGLWSQLTSLSSSLSLIDLNYILYRCDNEEKDEGNGGGVYVLPGAGPLVYCGLQVMNHGVKGQYST